jgi:hypothetical protein
MAAPLPSATSRIAPPSTRCSSHRSTALGLGATATESHRRRILLRLPPLPRRAQVRPLPPSRACRRVTAPRPAAAPSRSPAPASPRQPP